MNPDRKGALAGLGLAIVIIGLIYRVTIQHDVYAPGAFQLQQFFALKDPFGIALFQTYDFGQFVWLAVRKFYGTVTFTVIAFCLSSLFARPVRFWYTVGLLTILRFGLEVVERLVHHGDAIAESAFDVLTGTLAGALGALAYNAVAKRSETA